MTATALQPAGRPSGSAVLGFLLAGLLCTAARATDSGALYGTVFLEDGGEVTGALRWDGEEVMWIHHFNGEKAETFKLDELSSDDRDLILENLPGPQLEIDGHVVELAKWLGGSDLKGQFFGLEFGSIAELHPGRGERVSLTLRDGSVIEADNGSNDIGDADIEVMVGDGSQKSVDWRDIERIRFFAPTQPVPQFPPHLYGLVRTAAGDFEGFIEWDHDERRAGDRLDGEVNGADEEIEFGSIRGIAKEANGSRVTLTDGESKFMTGTNDVDADNRGIVVTGPDFGQVDIDWSAFQSLTFTAPPVTLPGFADFGHVGPLKGRVIDSEGSQQEGLVMLDLDQSHDAEILQGRSAGVSYRIPLRRIASLEPMDGRRSSVRLRGGRELILGVDNDVTQDNNGVVVRVAGSPPVYLPWSRLKRIEFDPRGASLD